MEHEILTKGAKLLDNRAAMGAMDRDDMLGVVENFPRQWREAIDIAYGADWTSLSKPRHVVLVGMGGSAIGSELVRTVLEDVAPVPIAVQKDETLPAYVGPDTLVVVSSYSGGTEETLSACTEALARGAQVAAITTGGTLGDLAKTHGFPVVHIPPGLSPRAAIGYSFAPLLVLMESVGLTGRGELQSQTIDVPAALQETADLLDGLLTRYGADMPYASNQAKQLAVSLVGKLPIIYGSGGWRGAAAYRWKCQFNENSKTYAVSNSFPELNHNETVGFELPKAFIENFWLIVLRESDDRHGVRVDVTKEIVAPRVSGVSEFVTEGRSVVARLFSLLYPADFVSTYLAFLSGVDPTPIGMIDLLKEKLNEVRTK